MQTNVQSASLKVKYECGCETELMWVAKEPSPLSDATQSLTLGVQMRAQRHLCGQDADLVLMEPNAAPKGI